MNRYRIWDRQEHRYVTPRRYVYEQNTGRVDYWDNPVYAGDIIAVPLGDGRTDYVTVSWDEYNHTWRLTGCTSRKYYIDSVAAYPGVAEAQVGAEVVGDIHTTPQLRHLVPATPGRTLPPRQAFNWRVWNPKTKRYRYGCRSVMDPRQRTLTITEGQYGITDLTRIEPATGLVDSHGKLIYVGDIVTVAAAYSDGTSYLDTAFPGVAWHRNEVVACDTDPTGAVLIPERNPQTRAPLGQLGNISQVTITVVSDIHQRAQWLPACYRGNQR